MVGAMSCESFDDDSWPLSEKVLSVKDVKNKQISKV